MQLIFIEYQYKFFEYRENNNAELPKTFYALMLKSAVTKGIARN